MKYRKGLIGIILLLVICIVLTGCTPKYDLTIKTQGEGIVNSSSSSYKEGEEATLTAKPKSNWKFEYWELEQEQNETSFINTNPKNPINIEMLDNMKVKAIFSRKNEPMINVWQTTFNGKEDNRFSTVQKTSSGGYILAGDLTSFSNINRNGYVLKIDSEGNKVWTKFLDKEKDINIYSIKKTEDNNFILVGEISITEEGHDGYIMKIDANGNEIWSKVFHNEKNSSFSAVETTLDGGIILAGEIEQSLKSITSDFYIVKVNKEGNKLWERSFGSDGSDKFHKIKRIKNNGFILVGQVSTKENGYDGYVLRIDSKGNKKWDSTFGEQEYDELYAIEQDLDGNFVLAGKTEVSGKTSGYVVKINSEGNKMWDKVFKINNTRTSNIFSINLSGSGNLMSFYSIQRTSDNGFILTGRTGSLVKIDSEGNKKWLRILGEGTTTFYSIGETLDGGFILVGETEPIDKDYISGYIVKIDQMGNTGKIRRQKLK